MPNSVGVCQNDYLPTAALTESSEKLVYPMSNILDLQRRNRVWRTNGNWEIASGANGIVFRETLAVDLTATITPGTYTTTTLMAAIKAAMDAAGDSTYTVTYVNGTTVRIQSNLGGGGGIFQIRGEAAGSTAMDTLGFDASAYTGASEYLSDDVRIHTSEWLQMDLAIPTNPKAFCLVGDRNEPLRISPSATIKLQANPTNTWTSPAFEVEIPWSDRAISVWNFEGIATNNPAGYRYWRFLIIDRDNPRGYLEFGAAYLGDMITFTRGCAVMPLRQRGVDNSTIVVSEGGQVWGQKKPKTRAISVGWEALTVTEEEALWEHWENVGITDNWFLVLDVNGAFSTNQRDRVMLLRFSAEHEDTLFRPRNFQANWDLMEAL